MSLSEVDFAPIYDFVQIIQQSAEIKCGGYWLQAVRFWHQNLYQPDFTQAL